MNPVHRRTFLLALMGSTVGLGARRAGAQAPAPAPPSIAATRITDRIVALSGNGGNVVVVIGAEGLLMIDGGLIGRGTDMARAVAAVSPQAVQVLFNTHYHFDHVGSNELVGAAGARIIAHENVAARVKTTFENQAMNRTMEALKPAGFPTETFTRGDRLSFGTHTFEYTHEANAHTDGDTYVFIPSANLLHTGDLFWTGRYPVVDYSAGGSLRNMVAALGRLEQVGDRDTHVVSGHGSVTANKALLGRSREIWGAISERLDTFARQGRTVDEVVAAAPTKDFDAEVGVTNAAPFVRQAYTGILRG